MKLVQRFKGIKATLPTWEASVKIIPADLWCVVILTQMSGNPLTFGLKVGDGTKKFLDLPWIFRYDWITDKISKPVVVTPSDTKFLAEDGEYYEIDNSARLTLDDIFTEIEQQNLEIPTTEEVAYLRGLMYKIPSIDTFTTNSPLVTAIEMGTSINGLIPFAWTLSEKQNIQSGSLAVSEGTWTGAGALDLKVLNGINLTLTSAPLVYNTIRTITYTLSLIDVKGNTRTRTMQSQYTHRIYYGTANVKNVTHWNQLTNVASKFSNSRLQSMNFTPIGEQYSIIMIPQEISQAGINIVNNNLLQIDHSFNMNVGAGGTVSMYSLTINGIIYNVYVSYNPSFGASVCTIK